MTKPIPDKAEIALEYPDKLYVGTFERSSRFEAHLDPTGITLILERPGTDAYENPRTGLSLNARAARLAAVLTYLARASGCEPRLSTAFFGHCFAGLPPNALCNSVTACAS